jgi:hypothetical protein
LNSVPEEGDNSYLRIDKGHIPITYNTLLFLWSLFALRLQVTVIHQMIYVSVHSAVCFSFVGPKILEHIGVEAY